MSQTTVIIIGASYAGIGVAHAILKGIPSVKVIVINPHNKLFFSIAAPRILAKPDAFRPEQYLLSIQGAFAQYPSESIEFIQDFATSIDSATKTVTVKTGASFSYDYLVIASGSTTASSLGKGSTVAPFKPSNAKDMEAVIKSAQQEVADAKSIIIAGGGAVGVEFAGEVAEAFKTKKGSKITLLTQTKNLLPTLKMSAGIAAKTILAKLNVEVLTSRKVQTAERDSETNKWTATLDNGETLTADLYISTTGVIPNNNFIPAEFLSVDGWVNVDTHLRVKSSSTKGGDPLPIYALGDITTYPQRLAYKVNEQVPIVAANIKAGILGQGKRPEYSPGTRVMMVVGTGQVFFGWVPWGWLVAFVKGKDYFISKASAVGC
ncbi:hypothetical protein PENARI_c002G07654 [Penicillium arizonense]|uniref:FAD/NAD(P)-binding domain-containing protein n=1 Tax=Penicillium arizonense TaxID=1835702 RepID=A0A1F5LU53_PENAI|nr:hypothetical protein PENARI_c002G07654 [Penicillium arizonense]OGE56728.1 hypothetical protein PENARI_c002G07654 [Penicillium arizonense]